MNDNYLKRLTSTCFLDQELDVVLIQLFEKDDWIIMDSDKRDVFGPNSFDICHQFLYSLRKQRRIK